MEISTIENIANLAKIAMNDTQTKEMAKSFDEILDYVEVLQKVDTTGVEPMAYMIAKRDVLRDDITGVEFSQEEALENAPIAKKGHFAIPKVLG